MFALLNLFAWSLSFLLAMIPTFINPYLWILSLIGTFVIKSIFFREERISAALSELQGQVTSSSVSPVVSGIESISPDTYTPPVSIPNDANYSQMTTESHTSVLEKIIKENTHTSIDEVSTLSIQEEAIQSIPEIPKEPSGLSLWIHSFFSDRPLAKIGGILIFLSALFFLWLIFDAVGPMGKFIIGILFGIFMILVGVYLDHKGTTAESRVVLGVGIAINYLTILSGRYLLGMGIGNDISFLSDAFAIILLFLNSLFAVILALVYRSNILLGFAFIFAYITPLLIQGAGLSTSLYCLYTLIITFSIVSLLFLTSRSQTKTNEIQFLQFIGIGGVTTLFSIASFSLRESEFILFFITFFLSIALLGGYLYRSRANPMFLFGGAYVVLFCLLFVDTIFIPTLFFHGISIFSLVLFVLSGRFTLSGLMIFAGGSFLLALFGFASVGSNYFFPIVIFGISIFLLLAFCVLHIGSMILGVFLLSVSSLFFLFSSFLVPIDTMHIAEGITFYVLALCLLIGAGIFTIRLRSGLIFCLSIVFSGILPLSVHISVSVPIVSLVSLGIYLFLSLLIPYRVFRVSEKIDDAPILFLSLPLSALVVLYGSYQFFHTQDMSSGVVIGGVYILIALLYLLYGFFFSQRCFSSETRSFIDLSAQNKTILLLLYALPLGIFTLALAFVFGDIPGVMSLSWIIEATLMYMLARRLTDIRVLLAAHAIFAIGIIRSLFFVFGLAQSNWLAFGMLLVMFAVLIAGLYIFRDSEDSENSEDLGRTPYDILHIIGMLSIMIGMAQIFPSTGTGWSIFGTSIFVLMLQMIYLRIGTSIHRGFATICFIGLAILFLTRFGSLRTDTLLPLMVQFLSLGIIGYIGFVSYRGRKTLSAFTASLSVLTLLVLTSLYVNRFFETFAVSLYLTTIASILIIMGIRQMNPKFRTLGLYIGSFALIKILFYDIWEDRYDAVFRVIALMIAGSTMIYLSQLYAKFVSRSWREEFSIENFAFDIDQINATQETISVPSETDDLSQDDPFSPELSQQMKNISISHLSGIRLHSGDGESFLIKRAGVIRIAVHIVTVLKKDTFAPHELDHAYTYTLNHLKSSLSPHELEQLLTKIRKWIDAGGSIEFIKN